MIEVYIKFTTKNQKFDHFALKEFFLLDLKFSQQ